VITVTLVVTPAVVVFQYTALIGALVA